MAMTMVMEPYHGNDYGHGAVCFITMLYINTRLTYITIHFEVFRQGALLSQRINDRPP